MHALCLQLFYGVQRICCETFNRAPLGTPIAKLSEHWDFGEQLHVGADSRSRLTHSACVMAVNTHDLRMLSELMHGMERRLYGNSTYHGEKQKAAMRGSVRGAGLHNE